MEIPEIIRDKIIWYIWKGKMREINREYKRIVRYDEIFSVIYRYGCEYNWRNLGNQKWREEYRGRIYNGKSVVGQISKKY